MEISVGRWRLSDGTEARVLAQLSDGRWVGERGCRIAAWSPDGSCDMGASGHLHTRLGDLPPPDVITGPGVYVTRGGTEINIICPSVMNRGWWVGEDCNGEVDHWLPCGNRSVTEEGVHSLIRRLRDLPETAK